MHRSQVRKTGRAPLKKSISDFPDGGTSLRPGFGRSGCVGRADETAQERVQLVLLALASIAAEDVLGYVVAVEAVLESFKLRDEYLEDTPVADTVLAAELESALLPG